MTTTTTDFQLQWQAYAQLKLWTTRATPAVFQKLALATKLFRQRRLHVSQVSPISATCCTKFNSFCYIVPAILLQNLTLVTRATFCIPETSERSVVLSVRAKCPTFSCSLTQVSPAFRNSILRNSGLILKKVCSVIRNSTGCFPYKSFLYDIIKNLKKKNLTSCTAKSDLLHCLRSSVIGKYKTRVYGYAGIVGLKDISWGFYMNFDNETL